MTKYLKEDEVGFDPQLVGFPGLGHCLAAVLETDQGLFGFHSASVGSPRISGFQTFILGKVRGTDQHLYGSCYWNERYKGSQKTQWTAEMTAIANAIGYHGLVSGFDTSCFTAHTSAPTKTEGNTTYLEYRKGPTKCGIFYKRSSKMQFTTGANDPVNPIHSIRSTGTVPVTYQLKNPAMKPTQAANIIATPSNLGHMHEAGFVGMHSFDIP